MAGLPQKPSFDPGYVSPTSRPRYREHLDDRRPPSHRSPSPTGPPPPRRPLATPMTSERYTRYDRPSPPRPRGPPVMADSYVAPGVYDSRRRNDDRYRDEGYPTWEPWEYARDIIPRSFGRHEREREWYEREQERFREEDRRRRNTSEREREHGREPARPWETRQDYDRRVNEYAREPRREDDRRDREYEVERRRERRPSVSPPRRTVDSYQIRRYDPRSPPRRAPSPVRSRWTRSPSPRRTPVRSRRAESPLSPGQVKLGAHSLAFSPNTPRFARQRRGREYDSDSEHRPRKRARSHSRRRGRTPRSRSWTRSRSPVRERRDSRSRSRSKARARTRSRTPQNANTRPASPDAKPDEQAMDVDTVERKEVVSILESPAINPESTEDKVHVPAPSLSPAKTEAPLPPTMDKGKAKATIEDTTPTAPRGPRQPPRGPRSSYMRTPTTPNIPIPPSPSPMKAPVTPSLTIPPSSNPPSPLIPAPSSLAPSVRYVPSPNSSSPAIPMLSSLPSSTKELLSQTPEGKRPVSATPRKGARDAAQSPNGTSTPAEPVLQEPPVPPPPKNQWPETIVVDWNNAAKQFLHSESRLALLKREYIEKSRAAKRAVHEYNLATIDLRLAEERRKVADAQLDKARAGRLGIDYVK